MKPLAFIAISLLACSSACSTDYAWQPDAAPLRSDLFVCYTHATCDGVTVNTRHEVCAATSSVDIDAPGDQAAQEWTTVWTDDCRQHQGIVESGADESCLDRDGNSALFACSVSCAPQYEACATP